jgi:hypothetical protein
LPAQVGKATEGELACQNTFEQGRQGGVYDVFNILFYHIFCLKSVIFATEFYSPPYERS